MTFQQLAYVIEVNQSGSINKAAQNLLLSQSAISTAIRDLEKELGIHLFVRNNRGVKFTSEGKEFVGYASSLLEQKRRIEGLYQSAQLAPAPIRFSVSTQRYPFTEDAFLRLLAEMDAPAYNLTIRESGMDEVIVDVCEHRSDVGVLFLCDETEKIIRKMMDNRNVEFHELASAPPCVYIRQEHPLAAEISLTEEKLAEYPYVFFKREQDVAADFSDEYHLVPYQRPTRNISVNHRTAATNVLATTNAFTTGSGLLTKGLREKGIITIPLRGKSNVHLGWVKEKHTKITPQAEHFVFLLEQTIEDSIKYTQSVHEAMDEVQSSLD